jgi:3-hydroxybutyryl-CoA dehydrogenase
MNDIKRVAIIGAGTMGRRIAFGCILGQMETRIFDNSPGVCEQAVKAVQDLIEERVATQTLGSTVLRFACSTLSATSSLSACVVGADLIIETVPENIELKRRVFADIDAAAEPGALIGTNTSSIPGSWLADATKRPGKVFNFNFGKPDDLKVEVMGHPGTAPETIETVQKFLRNLGLIPILVRGEIVGYATNRVWRAVKKEVLFLLDRGYSTADDIDRGWVLDWGTSMGPCGLMDMVGLDVIRDIEMVYYQASGDPSDLPPPLLHKMIERGHLGVKSGKGFYTYPDPAYKRPGWLRGER